MRETTTLQVIPSGAALGAEIRGLDLNQGVGEGLVGGLVEAIIAAVTEHLVLVIRDQRLSDADLVAFGRRFGRLHLVEHNEHDRQASEEFHEIEIVSNIAEDGVAIGSLGAGESAWHTDMSMYERPAWLTMLHAREVPAEGGDTQFANMYAACAALPDALRRQVEGRRAIHAASYLSGGQLRPGYAPIDDVSKAEGARHPVVRVHSVSGREALYLGRRRYGYILGHSLADSEEFLDRLWAHMGRAAFAWKHRWRVGDLLIWDNRATIHRRDAFDPGARRRLHRVTVIDDLRI